MLTIILLTTLFFSSFLNAQNSPYAVEVAAFAEPVKDGHFKNLDNVYETLDANYIYRYYLDAKNRSDAEAKCKRVIEAGFVNAHVVDFQSLRSQCSITCQYVAPKATGNTIKPFVPKEEVVINIPNLRYIFFDFDKFFLRPDAKLELDRLAQLLHQQPSYTVEIYGHTDARGSTEYNRALSNKRTNAAIKYLTKLGISPNRLVEKTYGESTPIAINEYPDGQDAALGRQYNRRVEFTIKDGQGNILNIVNDIDIPNSLQK